jgi:hypothetical protein
MAREQVFQNKLLVALSRVEGVRVWRQNSGKVVAARGGAVKGAPVGAADVTGIVGPEGWRLEIECKGLTTQVTKSQTRWIDTMRALGAIACVVRESDSIDVDTSVALAVEAITKAIAERRERG